MRLLFFVHTPLFFQETSVHRHRCHYRRHRLIQTTTITKKKKHPLAFVYHQVLTTKTWCILRGFKIGKLLVCPYFPAFTSLPPRARFGSCFCIVNAYTVYGIVSVLRIKSFKLFL